MKATVSYCIETRATDAGFVPAGVWYQFPKRGMGVWFAPEFGGEDEQRKWETTVLDDWGASTFDPALLQYISERHDGQEIVRSEVSTVEVPDVAAFIKDPSSLLKRGTK